MTRLWLFALLVLVMPQIARAHDARPLALTITEQGRTATGIRYGLRLRVPPSLAADNLPRVVLPPACQREGGTSPSAPVQRLVCTKGLPGQVIKVAWPIYNPTIATLVRLENADGNTTSQLLPPENPVWKVPQRPSPWQVAADTLRLGVDHILGGIDHLLFVAGLLLIAGTLRRVLWAVTGFTLAHSITLALATLGWVRVPIAPVEAVIALSILFLAREVARPDSQGLAARQPVLVSTSFGLLHGFGFAAALQEVGLPGGELAVGLAAFNMGVELGQLLFIALALAALLIWRRARKASGPLDFTPQGRARIWAAYGLGIPAAFWFVERLLAAF